MLFLSEIYTTKVLLGLFPTGFNPTNPTTNIEFFSKDFYPSKFYEIHLNQRSQGKIDRSTCYMAIHVGLLSCTHYCRHLLASR